MKDVRESLLVIFICSFLNGMAIDYDSLFVRAQRLQYSNADSAKINFQKCLPYYEEKGDTLRTIEIKLKLIQFYSGSGNYQKAYDLTWSVLPLVNAPKYALEQIAINQQLASLYIIFGQYAKASQHLDKAIRLCETIENEDQATRKISSLYGIKAWLITNETSDFKASEGYLLKALEKNKSLEDKTDPVYLQMQLGELYIKSDSLQRANEILMPIEQRFQKSSPIHSLLYDHLGQLYMKWENYETAISYFHKCLISIDYYQNHLDNKIEVLDSLAMCYHYLNSNDQAFKYAQESRTVSQELFGSRNSINRELYEIKDRYQDEIDKQKISTLEQEQKVQHLKTIIYISVLLIVIIALIVSANMRARKQKLIREKEAVEKQKKEYELESKNKELMTLALQMIERDAMLDEVGQRLKSEGFKTIAPNVVHELLTLISTDKSKKWDEFELYFTQVNQDFYNTLKAKHNALTATDLKMCALMKLGLSSKVMADIMGIGSDSVKTSRSRIRKKMELIREVNLIEYLRALS